MMRRIATVIAVLAAACLAPDSSGAQGTLSTQGFGYPTGQMSTRARGTGGGLGQFDPDSPINPASIANSSDPRVFLQYEPEFRRISSGDAASNTMTARFPVASVSVPFARRGSLGASFSTFLDRSSATSFTQDQVIAGQTVAVTETTEILGAINDLRLAAGYAISTRIQVGVGGHVYTGQNRVRFAQTFPDSLRFSPVSQVSTLGFTGYAGSVGVLLRPSRILGFALSARKGGSIEARSADTVAAEAEIPDRFGAAVSYEGLSGASISAHVSRNLWSSLNGLGSDDATAVDAWEGGVGAEALGPRIAARQTVLRLGARYRTLPFLAAGSEVNELSFGGGVGAQFFRNRAVLDVSFERASRKAEAESVDASERGYIFGFGLRVRP